jgi:fructosamine-3-kinase
MRLATSKTLSEEINMRIRDFALSPPPIHGTIPVGTAMSQDTDISWPVLRRIVKEWAGNSAELAEVTPLDGGCISATVALKLADGARAVLKISSHRVDQSYVRQAHQLELLRAAEVPVPKVYAAKTGTLDDPFSYILMEFIDGVDWSEARRRASPDQFDGLQVHLAELLQSIHRRTNHCYSRVDPDGVDEFTQWAAFYRATYDPICKEMEKSPLLGVMARKIVNRVRDRLDRLIIHDDQPRLTHWDLWASNLLAHCDKTGRWRVAALLDPHCKFAHAEAELAYLELFQTVGPPFMKAYQSQRKLGEDYHRVRKPVYQMHSLLNHVCLFGEPYAKRLTAAIERVGALV